MLKSFIAATAVLATAVFAQTETACNPLNVTCPKDTALGISNYTWDMSPSSNQPINFGIWNSTGSQVPSFDSNGLDFSIAQQGDSPTLVSTFYYFFGVCSVIMKASSGTGIISAVTALSDDLDEIDWEFKGGNDSYVFTNYYGKPYPGMQGVGLDVKLNFDPRADYHNYTTVWTNNTLQWIVDGNVVRTLTRDDPTTQGGLRYPQTPMTVKFGTWAGGSSSNKDTVAWAGGATDYSKGPFEMSVKQMYVSDASQGSFYEYMGNSGMSNSIKIWPGNSTVANALEIQNSHESLSQKVANLSSGAKIGIAIAAISVVAIGALTMVICCIKQRRAGRKERDIADAEFQKQEAELMAFRMANQRPGQMPGFGYNDFKGKR